MADRANRLSNCGCGDARAVSDRLYATAMIVGSFLQNRYYTGIMAQPGSGTVRLMLTVPTTALAGNGLRDAGQMLRPISGCLIR